MDNCKNCGETAHTTHEEFDKCWEENCKWEEYAECDVCSEDINLIDAVIFREETGTVIVCVECSKEM